MTIIANGFLALYCIDGFISLINDLFPGIPVLSTARVIVAGCAFLGAIGIYFLLAVTPRLPKRIFFLPAFFLLFLGISGGMPLPLYLGWHGALIALSFVQLLLGLTALGLVRYTTKANRWLLTDNAFIGPQFRLANTLGFVGINVLLVLPGTILYLILCVSLALKQTTGGFLQVSRHGIEAEAREYVRGNKTVHLIPMVHAGDAQYYQKIGNAYTGMHAVVIMEGVTDTHGYIRAHNMHQKIASTLGLQAQQADMFTNKYAIKRADVDSAVFSPETIRVLNDLGVLFQAKTIPKFLAAWSRYSADVDLNAITIVKRDLFDMRNKHCARGIRESLADYDCLLVPWGAAHMPYFEKFLIDRGFVLSNVDHRMVINFSRKH